MKTRILFTTVASALLATSTAISAEAGHFYIGAGLGGATIKDAPSADEWNAYLLSTNNFIAFSSVDDTDTGWKLFGGYMFNRNLAVEASYQDLGELSINSPITSPISGNAHTTWETQTVAISALGILPLAYNFDLFGKAGFHYWDADFNLAVSGGGGSGSFSGSDNGTDLLYGIGAAYNLTYNFALRLEWERYNNIGSDSTIIESDVDMWSAGIQYAF